MLTEAGRQFLMRVEQKDAHRKEKADDDELHEFYKQKANASGWQISGRNYDDEHNYEAASWMIEHGRRK